MKETYKKYRNTCLVKKISDCGVDEEKCKACYEDYINNPIIEVDQRVYNIIVKTLKEKSWDKD